MKRGAGPQRLVEKPPPEARDVDTEQAEQHQGDPPANRHRLPCQSQMPLVSRERDFVHLPKSTIS